MQRKSTLLALLILFWLPPLLAAQSQSSAEETVDPGEQEAMRKAIGNMRVKEAQSEALDPSLQSPLRSSTMPLQANISATQDKTQVKVELGFNSTPASMIDLHTSLKLVGPVNDNGSESDLATLEGLSNQVNATLGFHLLMPRPESVVFSVPAVKVHQLLSDAWSREHPGLPVPDDLATVDLSPAARRDIIRQLGLGHGILMISLESQYAAPKTFKFLAAETLQPQQSKHSGHSFSGALGWMPLRSGFYFVGGTFRYEVGHDANPKRNICTPFGGGSLECKDVVIGAPVESRKKIAQFELRKYFDGGRFAVNPKYSHDFEQGIDGIELPVYFLRNGDGLLNGGIAAGWRSDTHAITLKAFVGIMANPFGG